MFGILSIFPALIARCLPAPPAPLSALPFAAVHNRYRSFAAATQLEDSSQAADYGDRVQLTATSGRWIMALDRNDRHSIGGTSRVALLAVQANSSVY